MPNAAEAIYEGLIDLANRKPLKPITYGEFATRLGRNVRIVSNRKILDAIATEQEAKGEPDITFLLKRKDTGYPGQIAFERSEKPTPDQRNTARQKFQKVIERFDPGACNPY